MILRVLIIVICIPVLSYAQSYKGEWFCHVEIGSHVTIGSMQVDEQGNVYTIGEFSDDFSYTTPTGYASVDCNGESDIFIKKQNNQGDLLWIKALGGKFDDYAYSIAIDGYQNIYLTGSFKDTVDFNLSTDTSYYIAQENADGFILKVDSNGNTNWIKQFNNASCKSICLDNFGNIYTTGAFIDTLTVQIDTFNVTLITENVANMFVQKIDTSGNIKWVRQVGGEFSCNGVSIATDNIGNVYTAGNFQGIIDVDPSTDTLLLSGCMDVFVQKLDSSGNFIWGKNTAGNEFTYIKDLCIDRENNIYVTGGFNGDLDVDPGDDEYYISSNQGEGLYVFKLDSSGGFLWAKGIGGSNSSETCVSYSIDTDSLNNVFIVGSFKGSINFNSQTEDQLLLSEGYTNAFINKIDSLGNSLWAKKIGGSDITRAKQIEMDRQNNLFVALEFRSDLSVEINGVVEDYYSNDFFNLLTGKYSICIPDTLIPDMEELPSLTATCKLEQPIFPTATNSCSQIITASPNVEFPIVDNSITEIIWTYFDGYVVGTQAQVINWQSIYTEVHVDGLSLSVEGDFDDYQWVDCNNNFSFIDGEISSSFEADQSGSYAVIVNEGFCVDTSDCYLVTNTSLREEQNTFEVYPNPSYGSLYIESKPLESIFIYDINGITVEFKHENEIIDLSHLSRGVYFLKLVLDGVPYVKRIILL
jgi:hypothetical protein